MPEPAFDITPEKMAAADAWYWAQAGQLSLMGGPFQTFGYEYLVEPLRSKAQRRVHKKATQGGWTQAEIIRAIHKTKYGQYKQGVLYLFPTKGDVTDFSNSRFKPMINDNPGEIGQFVVDTDQANLKRIGSAFVYFRGAKTPAKTEGGAKNVHQLKSIPVDEFVCDEYDEMPEDTQDYAQGRLENSPWKNETYLANPTIPDWGIDKLYQLSDQRVWMVKCDKCGRYTCLELSFPSCLERLSNGKVIRLCTKCRDRELYPKNGRWVAQYPNNTAYEGHWISHLSSIRSNMTELLDAFESPQTNLTNFYNIKMGMAHIAAENRLTKNQVLALCGADPMDSRHDGPCGMGVDVGKSLHVTIGSIPYASGIRIVKMARVTNFSDVHDLAVKFNVKVAVFDLYPETRKVREFRAAESYPVFGCDYQENQKGAYAWNEQAGIVTVNRTEVCDASHNLVTLPGRMILPRRDAEVEEYAQEMSNIAKVLEEDDETGSKVYRYRKLGADHYRHSTNYMMLACERMLVASGGMPAISVPGEVQKAPYKYD